MFPFVPSGDMDSVGLPKDATEIIGIIVVVLLIVFGFWFFG